ncbi:MAG: ribulose-phosphate 3-epimerase [Patescibacteria group bacterium]|mgnify:CR=1 FL=1
MQRIIPAILTSDPIDLRKKLEFLKGHTNWVQIDIMDGKFVPNASVSIFELGEAYEYFNLELHLMVENPEQYFQDCDGAGAKRVFFHYEAAPNLQETLAKAKQHQFHIGLALNPTTDVKSVTPYLKEIDSVLVLAVNPGFQGQEFIPSVLQKVKEIRELSPEILIGIDGGINESNIKQVFSTKIDYAAVGSGIWNTGNPLETLKKLGEMVQ